MHLEKNRTYACTFPVQRKVINVVKVRFTMRYSSGKLSNDKVITTACNFWRQIACSFQVMSGNILFLGNKIFEIPPFFQTRPGDLGKKVHACSLRFSALKVLIGLRTTGPSSLPWILYSIWQPSSQVLSMKRKMHAPLPIFPKEFWVREWIRIPVGYLWMGEFDLETDTCGRGIFWIQKEKVADSKISDSCRQSLNLFNSSLPFHSVTFFYR